MTETDDLFDTPRAKPPPLAAGDVRLVPVSEGDRFLIRRWLALPHVAAWFGSRAAAEAIVTIAETQPSAIRRLVLLNGRPVGYVHAVDAGQHFTLALRRPRHESVPAGAVLAEIFIADRDLRGRGVGAAALTQLCADVFATTLAPAVALVAGIRHERQVRSLERAGFAWTAVIADPTLGAAWLLIARRQPSS